MNSQRVLKCLLFFIYFYFYAVYADSRDVMSRGQMVANRHLTHIQESQQHSLSEFSQELSEKPKFKKRKGKKKSKRKTILTKNKNKDRRRNKKYSKINGPVDIVVHIKMNE